MISAIFIAISNSLFFLFVLVNQHVQEINKAICIRATILQDGA